MTSKPLLNFGCGGHFHRAWVNVDLSPVSSEVMKCDLASGLLFPEGHFSAVYSSHVMEHLDPETGSRMLRECRRVLAPGGICRIVVPDLESQARQYLEKLREVEQGDAVKEGEYDWAVIELLDQMVRSQPGGRMLEYLCAPTLPASAYVSERIGQAALKAYRGLQDSPGRNAGAGASLKSAIRRLLSSVRKVGAASFTAELKEAKFRKTGEIHRWMYDRFSARRALLAAGFATVSIEKYDTSGIPDFASYGLDVDDFNEERRPHSLYVEGRV